VKGIGGHVVPVLLLDTDLPENAAPDRGITDHLYGGDSRYRLTQEAVARHRRRAHAAGAGHTQLRRFHMNEGHAALLVIELGWEEMLRRGQTVVTRDIAAVVRPLCVFTTHTPVRAGHDQFPVKLVRDVITDYGSAFHERVAEFCLEHTLNMTYLALDNSQFVNGVAKRHGEISRHMFAQYKIDSITNGVHAGLLGRASDRRAVRPPHRGLARGQRQPALCARHPEAGAVDGAPAGQGRADPQRERARRRLAGSECLHHRLRAPGHDLETRRPAVPRRAAAARAAPQGRVPADRLRRQGPTRTTRAARS